MSIMNRNQLIILGMALVCSTLQASELKKSDASISRLPNNQLLDVSSETVHASEVAAEKWLTILDSGKYAETWNDASMTLKIKLPQKSWIKIMEAMRQPLGALKSRKMVEQIPKTNPKGLPEGEYMIILYSSSFANKDNVKELVILQQERNGEWRILTYQSGA